MSVIALANLKGGVGKTTIGVNLAACLMEKKGIRVALVDADSQGSATAWAREGHLPMAVHTIPLQHNEDPATWLRRVDEATREIDHVIIDLPPYLGSATAYTIAEASLVLVGRVPGRGVGAPVLGRIRG